MTETFKVYKKDSIWIRETFNSTRLMTKKETFADRKLKILNGEYLEYENDKIALKGTYLNGKETGLWTEFDADEKPKETMVLEDGTLNGPYIIYWENGTTKISENYVKGWKAGEKKIFYENGNLALRELYDAKSKITNSTYLDMKGKPVTKEEVITEPLFPGGMKNFYMYLGRSIKFPVEAQVNKVQGKVYVSLLIGRTGKIERIRIISSPHKSLAGEAVRVIGRSPDWIPGTLFGNPASLPSIVIINFTSR